jgi:hypothetical protein
MKFRLFVCGGSGGAGLLRVRLVLRGEVQPFTGKIPVFKPDNNRLKKNCRVISVI